MSARFPLHLARDAATFRDAFAAETGRGLEDVLSEFVDLREIRLVVIGGSIPLGIATEASDIDLMVVIDSAGALHNARTAKSSVMFTGAYTSASDLALATSVIRLDRTELDLQFLAGSPLTDLLRLIKSRGVALTFHQRQFIARLRTGWRLFPSSPPDLAIELMDDSFDRHCAVQSMINCYRFLVDARVAAKDEWYVSFAMGRHSVEKAFEAYFASRGYGYLGLKWLRFLSRHCSDSTETQRGRIPTPLAVHGRELLFPCARREDNANYLTQVETFVAEIRKLLDSDLRLRVALDVSPFIGQPRAVRNE